MAKKKRKPIRRESGYGRLGLAPPPYVPLPKLSKPKSSGGGGTTLPAGIPANTNVTPNLSQILAQDPFYQATHAQYMANTVADQATRDASIKRAIIDFGGNPAGYVDPGATGLPGHPVGGVVDADTLALAQKNTDSGMSILARLAAAAKDNRQNIVDSGAAHGLFNSGFTGSNLGRAQLAGDQANYDATKNLLDYLAGVQAAYVQSQRQNITDDANAAQTAAQNWDGSVAPAGVPIIEQMGLAPSGTGRIAGKTIIAKPSLGYAKPNKPGKPNKRQGGV